ncbi:putative PEP-binding protein [Streptomyces coffeae]|uniref:Pyruvate, phosphate dikinase n=1 Tax=Streptomyces coffeae TaxID=621382 RepID=A0ABS1NM03_9ACTN|nr:putative PEP-binding protein [Streptomyces coffeae]MBL1101023.1 pyruvate, phosphate dikinase [Streptomyces coffeae]
MSPASQQWLAGLAGDGFAAERRAALAAALALADPDAALPDDPVEQVIVTVRALTGAEPNAAHVGLGRQPLWCGPDSGSGLAHSCDPSTGRSGVTGSFLAGGSGAQLLTAGGVDLDELLETRPWGRSLREAVQAAETELDWPARVEFVVEHGRPIIVRITRASLHGAALLHAVATRYERGRLTRAQAVSLVEPRDVDQARSAAVPSLELPAAARGLGVSPGIASGTVVFSAAEAVAARADGEQPVLVLTESRPPDLPGLLASTAVVTERGGQTSHAAVVARGLGLPAVAALVDGVLDAEAKVLRTTRGDSVRAGDLVTVDGHAGVLHLGGRKRSSAERRAALELPGWLGDALSALPGIAVRVNADTGADAAAGRALGASGVGLCRLEHMFLGERHQVLQRVLMARPGPDMTEDLATLHMLLRAEITDVLAAMDGLPVTIRLLDPPRHEFLPDLTELSLTTAATSAPADRDRLDITRRLHERNPMLGVRGVRMGVLLPMLTAVQIKALAQATLALRRAGRNPRPELLVPMVSASAELDFVRGMLDDVCAHLGTSPAEAGISLGAMIETPRAALLTRSIARRADSLSLGTNDLTALVWGLSRDDAEQHLLPAYQDMGLLAASPFALLDVEAVGTLARQVADEARAVRPDITLGVCGEQAADAAAVRFFAEAGFDHISCSPPRVPLVRLAAARAALAHGAADMHRAEAGR